MRTKDCVKNFLETFAFGMAVVFIISHAFPGVFTAIDIILTVGNFLFGGE